MFIVIETIETNEIKKVFSGTVKREKKPKKKRSINRHFSAKHFPSTDKYKISTFVEYISKMIL